jgi:hypothetical protein
VPCLRPLRCGITLTAKVGNTRTGDIKANLGASVANVASSSSSASSNFATYLAIVFNALTTCLLALA